MTVDDSDRLLPAVSIETDYDDSGLDKVDDSDRLLHVHTVSIETDMMTLVWIRLMIQIGFYMYIQLV